MEDAKTMNLEQQRQTVQLEFVNSKQNLKLGDLNAIPLTLDQLKKTTSQSPYVVETFKSGLTAIVYHIRIEGKDWTLKTKRSESLVQNIDGQTSFLNEVQRRIDLSALKQSNPEDFQHIVETQYASFQDGIILSPWIDGAPLQRLDKSVFDQIFNTVIHLELRGLFEWDFCPGNILQSDSARIKLFDFGYMYRFDPKIHFNSNGVDTPIFHGVERFETRFFFDYLLKNPLQLSEAEKFDLYKLEKHCALLAYQNKLKQLKLLGASAHVIEHQTAINNNWELAIQSAEALQDLFIQESFRSNLLDLLDDIHGKSCSSYTIQKSDFVLDMLTNNFEKLKSNDGFFFGDEHLDKQQLLVKYQELKQKALDYQLIGSTA
ncbi:hypothetical protein [Vibrio genomosp. F10]|uniref:hypothetical protein n=1 Tax=Vibrio genomosp. F10 TaxID=723171 RepID=UPI0003026E26|nr:hypothetical protein [Vibrio genomosp. F10]OEF05395.1 hypothetical protein A1QI_08525 [Vibrio genomosp. F10 str. 9ZB36]